jgi:hypothetical protein
VEKIAARCQKSSSRICTLAQGEEERQLLVMPSQFQPYYPRAPHLRLRCLVEKASGSQGGSSLDKLLQAIEAKSSEYAFSFA